jgi:hypothetical protein
MVRGGAVVVVLVEMLLLSAPFASSGASDGLLAVSFFGRARSSTIQRKILTRQRLKRQKSRELSPKR